MFYLFVVPIILYELLIQWNIKNLVIFKHTTVDKIIRANRFGIYLYSVYNRKIKILKWQFNVEKFIYFAWNYRHKWELSRFREQVVKMIFCWSMISMKWANRKLDNDYILPFLKRFTENRLDIYQLKTVMLWYKCITIQ